MFKRGSLNISQLNAWFADKFQGCGSHCQSTLKLRFWCPNQSTIGESLSIHRGNPLWWISLFLISRRSWRNPRLVIPLLLNSFVGGFISFFLVTNRFFQKNTTHQQIPMVPRFLEGAVVPLAYTKAAKASAINRAFHQQKSGNLSRQKWNMNSKQKVTCIAYMGIFTDQRKKIWNRNGGNWCHGDGYNSQTGKAETNQ